MNVIYARINPIATTGPQIVCFWEVSMPRPRKGDDLVNPTQSKLAKLPFKSASDLRHEQEEIQKTIWRQLEEGRWLREYSLREEYQYRNEILGQGIECRFGKDKEQLIRIYADKSGKITVDINEKNGRDLTSQELLETLSRALTESFGTLFYKASGLLPSNSPSGLSDLTTTNSHPKKGKDNG
jgi:hypothetical protein